METKNLNRNQTKQHEQEKNIEMKTYYNPKNGDLVSIVFEYKSAVVALRKLLPRKLLPNSENSNENSNIYPNIYPDIFLMRTTANIEESLLEKCLNNPKMLQKAIIICYKNNDNEQIWRNICCKNNDNEQIWRNLDFSLLPSELEKLLPEYLRNSWKILANQQAISELENLPAQAKN